MRSFDTPATTCPSHWLRLCLLRKFRKSLRKWTTTKVARTPGKNPRRPNARNFKWPLFLFIYGQTWFKHILLVNTKGLGVAKLRRKPSPGRLFWTINNTEKTPISIHIWSFMTIYQVSFELSHPQENFIFHPLPPSPSLLLTPRVG